MSIIRTTEGEHITEIEKGWTVFTDEFEAYAGQCSHFTAKDGTVHGQPLKDENKKLKYFKDGWWSSDAEGSNRITEAKIGDNVYFNIEMKNIKDLEMILLELNVNSKYKGTISDGEVGIPISENNLVLPCGIYGRWESNE